MKIQTKESPAGLQLTKAYQRRSSMAGEGNIFVHMPIINAFCIRYCLEIKTKKKLATLG